MVGRGSLFEDGARAGGLALCILWTGTGDRRLLEEDGAAFHMLLLCDHGLLADLACDFIAELAFDPELANDVGVELEGCHGFYGGGSAEV